MYYKYKRKTPKTNRQKLIDRCDRVFSTYRRLLAADWQGVVRCVTCGKFFHWKRVDCGHFIGREFLSTRWSMTNTAPQCHDCNRHKEGLKHKFKEYIDNKYGEGVADKLELTSQFSKKTWDFEIEMHVKYFKEKLKILEGKT